MTAVIALLILILSSIFTFIGYITNIELKFLPIIPVSTILVLSIITILLNKKKHFFFVRRIVYPFYRGFKSIFKTSDKNIYINSTKKLSPSQEKSIKLWRSFLKDKTSFLSSSITTFNRHITNGDIMLIIAPSYDAEYKMTIFNTNEDKRCLYEITLPESNAHLVCKYFDDEMQRRMKFSETRRRLTIESDLDKIILQQEELIKNKLQREKNFDNSISNTSKSTSTV